MFAVLPTVAEYTAQVHGMRVYADSCVAAQTPTRSQHRNISSTMLTTHSRLTIEEHLLRLLLVRMCACVCRVQVVIWLCYGMQTAWIIWRVIYQSQATVFFIDWYFGRREPEFLSTFDPSIVPPTHPRPQGEASAQKRGPRSTC